MALVTANLMSDLLSAFNRMYETYEAGERIFADEVAKACDNFAESGLINTIDAGPVSGGVFSGAGKGSLACEDVPCADEIFAACNAMYDMAGDGFDGDSYLAQKLAEAIDNMILAGVITCDVAGMVNPPSGSSFPRSGTSKGTFTCVPHPLQAAFLSAFYAMRDMKEDGDRYLAQQMANAVNAYLLAGVANTQGTGNLAGSVGVGKMI
jgi:hypothetical protein